MTLDTDTFFTTILDIKETVTRTEEKVDGMSDLKTRVESLEASRNQVYGIMGTISLAWVVLVAWINGMGDWIHHLFVSPPSNS